MDINVETFYTHVSGTEYRLPCYEVETGKGLVETHRTLPISFVRGSSNPQDNAPSHRGVTHEGLLAILIYDLSLKNELVPSEDTRAAMANLQKALQNLRDRAAKRKAAGVQGTYKKTEN